MKAELKAIREIEQELYNYLRSAPMVFLKQIRPIVDEYGVDSVEVRALQEIQDFQMRTIKNMDAKIAIILKRNGIAPADVTDLEEGKWVVK